MFWLSLLVPTAIIAGVIIFAGRKMSQVGLDGRGGPASAQQSAPPPAWNIAVTDRSGRLADALDRAVKQFNASRTGRHVNLERPIRQANAAPDQADTLNERVRDGTLDAHIVLAEDVVAGKGTCSLHTRAGGGRGLALAVNRLVNDAVAFERLRAHGLRPEPIAEVLRPVYVERVALAQPDAEKPPDVRAVEKIRHLMSAFFVLFLMFMAIISSGQLLLTSLIEEKASRVIEVLLSAVSPFQLMAGKIAGLAGVGFTFAAVCGGVIWVAASVVGLESTLSLGSAGWFLVYFILGFPLIASVYAAAGAACNTLKEAQTTLFPLMLIFALPVVIWMPIGNHPDAWWAVAMSLFPPTAPMVMILRVGVQPDVPLLQVLASVFLLAAAVPAAVWAAAKIFRTGILMYGKPPRLRELLRWVRYR